MTTENDAIARVATKLKTMTTALHEIKKQASSVLDKGDVLGAGRRLERILMTTNAALDACDAQEDRP